MLFVPCIVNSCDFTVHALGKKKKEKKKRLKTQTWVWKRGSKPTLSVRAKKKEEEGILANFKGGNNT